VCSSCQVRIQILRRETTLSVFAFGAGVQPGCHRQTHGLAISALLAAAVLRFQRVEREEKEREDELHALQSGEARTRGAPEGLDLEQLPLLLEERGKSVRSESGAIVRRDEDARPHTKESGTRAIVRREVANCHHT